jgi:acetyl esterase/lipase
MLIHVASDEVLYPSAHALAERATAAGVHCEFHAVNDSVHSFVLFPFLPEADAALQSFAAFARQTAATLA